MTIFGATGDLTYRKLIPALYALFDQKILPDNFHIVGAGRRKVTDEDFRSKMAEGIRKFSENIHLNESEIEEFLPHISYFTMDIDAASDYSLLREHLTTLNSKTNTGGNYIFYLSLPPDKFGSVSTHLGIVGLNNGAEGFKRLIIEKPFGYDLESGRALNKTLHKVFDEDQIYRIDHYLGKETVQNLLVMRFANGIFEPLWNRNYIHRIEVTSAENIGVEGRGGYYEGAGALRDMLQNHLLQVVGLVAMEPPASADANSIRNEILKVMQSLRPISPADVASQVIRGQYTASHVRGEKFAGYREEPGVDPDSRTETYVAMKFFVDNWRWGGVPFYIRTGKRLPTRVTEVVVHFRPTPHGLFQENDGCKTCNKLIVRIQPDEGIVLKFAMKNPGTGFNIKTVSMDFHYSDLSNVHLPSAYERLLYDAMVGDSTLFARADVVEAAWKFVDPVLKTWSNDPEIKIFGYPAGTWGPDNADSLIEDSTEGWRYPCKNLADDGEYCEL